MDFQLVSEFSPSGDQPGAIAELTSGLNSNKKNQILLGVTGSGKTFSIANAIQNVNRPTLVIAHNKTLAAQLCAEFRAFFPHNAVEYFVSYYDYYQPEAYIPGRDVYIEKEAQVNEEIEKLRHSATHALMSRRDVIIVASVSCIYGLGLPENYLKGVIQLAVGQSWPRRQFLLGLEQVRYDRNDVELKRGRYRVTGDVIDIFPAWEDRVLRIEFFGDDIEKLIFIHPVTGEIEEDLTHFDLFPATHYMVGTDLSQPIGRIKAELETQLATLKAENKLLEAQRLEQRTKFDLEMMAELGYCKGIENYSRQLSNLNEGDPPGVLLDFFPDDFLTVVDESHATMPQLRGMYNGDRSRKKTLVDFGFRLPSAMDNRPLKFEEIEAKLGQVIYVSATPGPYELELCRKSANTALPLWEQFDVVQQIIRPTGLTDPEVFIRSTKHQIDDLMSEIDTVISRGERVLVTTLTKKMSEELTEFLLEKKIKVQYLHSEVHALDRLDILHDLRRGKYDVLIGVNLLREGLDLPEVALVAIMDADKEGFLRNERSLIQTMGRAARNINGKVLLYADKTTQSMSQAIAETQRRRSIQMHYNHDHGIVPTTIRKSLTDIRSSERDAIQESFIASKNVSPADLPKLIQTLKKQMNDAAKNLEFEVAAVLRDEIDRLMENTQA